MLSSRTYRTTATVGRMSQRLPVMSTLGSLRNVFLGLHRLTGIQYAQNGLREREARTATVCSVKRKTSEGKRLAYSAMTPSRSGMRTGTLLRPRRSPSTPARIGGPSPLAPALGWCSTTEGHAVLPGIPKAWPKIKTSLRTSPRTTRTRGFDGRMDSLLTHQIADEVDRKVAELGQEDVLPEVVERIFLDVAKVNKKGRVLGLGMMSQMYTSASGSSTQSSGTSQLQWKACKRLLHYLNGTASQSLHFQPATHLFLSAFSDADLASSVDDRKSTGGFCVFLGPNLVAWSSKKQRVVSRSRTESDYRSFDDAAVGVIWVKSLLAELGFNINPQPVIWCHNQSAATLASNPLFQSRTKHIEIDRHFVREEVVHKELDVRFVLTSDQLADIFTKPLSISRFQVLCNNFPLDTGQRVGPFCVRGILKYMQSLYATSANGAKLKL